LTDYAILDVETTIFQKGTPFADRNRLCYVGIRIGNVNYLYDIEYSDHPYAENLARVRELLSSVRTVVAFNAKFDLNWLARYGIWLDEDQRVYDLQVAEFIYSKQQVVMPSLDYCLHTYGLGEKLHVIEEEYWNHDIDTPNVPRELLIDYLRVDLEKEDELYQMYRKIIPQSQDALLRLLNADLRVLQEMEYNGLQFDWDQLSKQATETKQKLEEVNAKILEWVEPDFRPFFNPGSGDHLSALLYGGVVSGKIGTPYEHIFKGGNRAGQTAIRTKWETNTQQFKRLVAPIEGSRLKKDGFWSTDLFFIRQLPKPKRLISLLLERADLEKLHSTYYEGLHLLRNKMDWTDGFLHGQFNQCVARTGRLSASNPNQQNFDKRIHQYITTRYR